MTTFLFHFHFFLVERCRAGAVLISSRAVRIFPAISLQCIQPSYGTFFLMVFQRNCSRGHTGHMIIIVIIDCVLLFLGGTELSEPTFNMKMNLQSVKKNWHFLLSGNVVMHNLLLKGILTGTNRSPVLKTKFTFRAGTQSKDNDNHNKWKLFSTYVHDCTCITLKFVLNTCLK